MKLIHHGLVYVKFIDYVANHPRCTWKDINSHVHPGKPLYTGSTEFGNLVPKYIKRSGRAGRCIAYEVTDDGLKVKHQADKCKWLTDFTSLAKKFNANSLSKMSIMCSIHGMCDFIEESFLKKFLEMRNGIKDNEEDAALWRFAERNLSARLLNEITNKAEALNKAEQTPQMEKQQ